LGKELGAADAQARGWTARSGGGGGGLAQLVPDDSQPVEDDVGGDLAGEDTGREMPDEQRPKVHGERAHGERVGDLGGSKLD
jgi:hypothetical protein